MQVVYLDCSTGISGDMTLGALIDAGVDVETIRRGIDSLGLPDVRLATETVIKGGFRATYIHIEHPEQHAHRHLSDILQLIDAAEELSPSQRTLATEMFTAVATAEATVHGSTIDKVHFHEVGAIDSIVDIVGVAIGFDLLGADSVVCSPVPTGWGQIQIAHGLCTVPAPGTAELLKGIPLADVPVDAELTTPTGAAIVRVLADRFGPLPEMTIDSIGYGAGTHDFPQRANVLRLFVGTAVPSAESDQIDLLETNLDDVTAEIIGYTKQKLFAAGALDVYTIPIQMKKERPGVILAVITRPADCEAVEEILFAETGTFGIRRMRVERSIRARQEHVVETIFGPVQGKLGWRAGEPAIFVPEFDDCARIAAECTVPVRDVYRAATSSYHPEPPQPSSSSSSHIHDHDHDHDHIHDHDHDHDH